MNEFKTRRPARYPAVLALYFFVVMLLTAYSTVNAYMDGHIVLAVVLNILGSVVFGAAVQHAVETVRTLRARKAEQN